MNLQFKLIPFLFSNLSKFGTCKSLPLQHTLSFLSTQCLFYSSQQKMADAQVNLKFDNTCLRFLPVDNSMIQGSRTVPDACFSRVRPSPILNPKVVCLSEMALQKIGVIADKNNTTLVNILCGNTIAPGSEPASHCYCGHQFGYFSGQLGDGAAMYLGEVINKHGEKWEIQLKGAGKTPYSRFSDGRKVLRSSIREFLASEHLHALGIPTTRACSVITSDTRVPRDIYYTGDVIQEKATVVMRMAHTFLRFGSFEICKPLDFSTFRKGPSHGNNKILRTLANFAIQSYFPEIVEKFNLDCIQTGSVRKEKFKEFDSSVYESFYLSIVEKTAKMVAKWQCFGFCHGVLNTDNMSIIGLTIDYGPYGFLEYCKNNYQFISNLSDENGRYSFEKQPEICRWNCKKLGEALLSLLPNKETIDKALQLYDQSYNNEYWSLMTKKFGYENIQINEYRKNLIEDFFELLSIVGADWTNSFQKLTKITSNLLSALSLSSTEWNPSQIMKESLTLGEYCNRNYLTNANTEVIQLKNKWEHKYNEFSEWEQLYNKFDISKTLAFPHVTLLWSFWLSRYIKQWVAIKDQNPEAFKTISDQAVQNMKSSNPTVVLRNSLAQVAIDAAEKGDYEEVQQLLNVLIHPFQEHPTKYTAPAAEGTRVMAVS